MMDCDLLFENADWYDDVSVLLDTHHVVQPFKTAVWLDSDLKTITLKRNGYIYTNTLGEKPHLARDHPGFAWAFRRDFIESKGIYDLNVMGSGDTIIASAIIQKHNLGNPWEKYSPYWMLEKYNEYFKLFENTKYTFYDQSVFHLWHGSNNNRNYNKRYEEFQKICLEHNIVEKSELFTSNNNGLYEFNPQIRDSINAIFLKYFESRQEDGI